MSRRSRRKRLRDVLNQQQAQPLTAVEEGMSTVEPRMQTVAAPFPNAIATSLLREVEGGMTDLDKQKADLADRRRDLEDMRDLGALAYVRKDAGERHIDAFARRVAEGGVCVGCGEPVDPDEEGLRKIAESYVTATAGFPDDAIAAVKPVLWCADCAGVRDQAIVAMRKLVDGGTVDAEDRRLVGLGMDFAHKCNSKLRDQNGDRPVVPSGNAATLIELATRIEQRSQPYAKAILPGLAPKYGTRGRTLDFEHGPRWAGTNSYDLVRRACVQGAQEEWVRSGGKTELSPAGLCYVKALEVFDVAHPIVIPPAQVDVLPPFEHTEAQEYARTMRLPFPVVYLDMMGPDGMLPGGELDMVRQDTGERMVLQLNIVGALLWEQGERTGRGREIWCVPFSTFDTDRPTVQRQVETTGAVVATDELIEDDQTVAGIPGVAAVCVRPWRQYDGAGHPVKNVPGYILPALPASAVVDIAQETIPKDQGAYELGLMCAAAFGLFRTAVNALMFLDSVNVELTAAPVQPRVLKRAAKRKWKINTASTIAIRHTIRHGARPASGGRDYRTRFEVIGHYNHVTRGSHVRCGNCRGTGEHVAWRLPDGRDVDGPGVYGVAGDLGPIHTVYVDAVERREVCSPCDGTGVDQSKVKPCVRRDSRTGVLTCPHGCRREWVPLSVRGNPGAPLQVKTRTVHGA